MIQLGVIINDTPDILYSVKKGSPLVIGVGIGEHFIASDMVALASMTSRYLYMEEGDTFAMPTFFYSLWYLAALFGFMLIDVFFQL